MKRNSVHSGDSTMMAELITKGSWKNATSELRKGFEDMQLIRYFMDALTTELESPRNLFDAVINSQPDLASNKELYIFLKTIINKLNQENISALTVQVEKDYPKNQAQQVVEPAEQKEELHEIVTKTLKLNTPQKTTEPEAPLAAKAGKEDISSMWAFLEKTVADAEKQKKQDAKALVKPEPQKARRVSLAPQALLNRSTTPGPLSLSRRASMSGLPAVTTPAPSSLSRRASISGLPAVTTPAPSSLSRRASISGLPAVTTPAPSTLLRRSSISGLPAVTTPAASTLKRTSTSGIKQPAAKKPASTPIKDASASGQTFFNAEPTSTAKKTAPGISFSLAPK